MTPPAPYTPTTYAPPSPSAQYTEGDPLYDEIQRRINHWAEQTDPQKQAEQDAIIQRGRNFWTGANLFANVIANAINVNGTAKGAPSMTFNDAASQKMYDAWQQQDKELKADRRAAQERLDALTMQDASLRHADRQAADKAALDVYNINYKNQEAARQASEKNDAEYEQWLKKQEYLRNNPIPYRSGSGSGVSSKSGNDNVGKYNISLGGVTIQANTKGDSDFYYESLYDDMEGYLKEHPEALGDVPLPTNKALRRKFVEKYFEQLYTENEDFRNAMDKYYGDAISFNGEIPNADTEQTTAGNPQGIPSVTEGQLRPSWMQNAERMGRQAGRRINARNKGTSGGGIGKGPVQTMPWSDEFTEKSNKAGVNTVTQQPDWKKAKKEMEDRWGLNDI